MYRKILFSFFVILLLMLSACVPSATVEPTPTRRVISLEEDLAAEERAAEEIATVRAEKTQAASRVSPYVKLSNGEQRYLAFWFTWNDETVLLPLNEFNAPDSGLITCRLESGTEIIPGILITGFMLESDECVADETAAENAPPLIKIPRYFEGGIETQDLIVIDLNGEYTENLADILTIIVKNDILGSGNLSLSVQRTDGLSGEPIGDENVVPTYMLPEGALRVSFSTDQIGEMEYAEDVAYALEREFTWKIPDGFSDLNLSPGDENWFVLSVKEMQAGNDLEEEYLSKAYIQVKGVGTSPTPDN